MAGSKPRLRLKKSSVPAKVPLVGDLEYGELALNYNDGKLWYKNSSNQIKSFVDSAGVETIITDVVDNAFVDALNVDADTLDNQDGIYYLDYNNFSNTPNIIDSANVSSLITYETLNTNGDVGTGASQVAQGNHTHNYDASYLSATNSDSADGLINFNSGIQVENISYIKAEQNTFATVTTSTIATFAHATYAGGEFLISVSDTVSGDRQSSKILITHDGTTAVATEYAIIHTSSAPLATFTVDISGSDVRIMTTAASANSTEYSIHKTLLEV